MRTVKTTTVIKLHLLMVDAKLSVIWQLHYNEQSHQAQPAK